MSNVCKIYLLTYRRNDTLPRALDSLIQQTYKNWICEVHNDAPGDLYPEQLVKQVNDSRVKIFNHKKNLGAIASFNLVFENTDCKYVSLLEDDNWWEPHFLERMVDFMDNHPEVQMSWANMKKWKEHADGTWEDTDEYVWPVRKGFTYFNWPHEKQLMGALHSNGAMLLRNQNISKLKLAESATFSEVEALRERIFQYPLVLLNEHSANFALTISTSRPGKSGLVLLNRAILAGSFLKYDKEGKIDLPTLWKKERNKRVRHTHIYIWSSILFPEIRYILKNTNLSDWLFFVAYYIKNYKEFFSILSNIRKQGPLKDYIEQQTRIRFQEAKLL